MALRILYHGTDAESAKAICDGIDLNVGSNRSDFGKGFYTTDDFYRASKWARHTAYAVKGKPAVVKMYFDEEAAKPLIRYLEDDLNWGRFIINNRNGREYIDKVTYKDNNLDAKYEITVGRIADLNVLDVVDELRKSGKMLDSIGEMLNPKYPLQIVFHTERAISYIKKISYQNI